MIVTIPMVASRKVRKCQAYIHNVLNFLFIAQYPAINCFLCLHLVRQVLNSKASKYNFKTSMLNSVSYYSKECNQCIVNIKSYVSI